jgi:hypothetical protein
MLRRCGVGFAVALAAALAGAAPAPAATPTEVAALLTKPCPTQYRNVFQRQWSPAEQEAALAGDFPILQNGYPAHLEPPVDWDQDPYSSLTWRHWLHTLGWWMDALFFIHREGGPQATQALEQARDLTLDWIAQNPLTESQGHPNNPPWAPKPTADRPPYIAYLTRQAACKGLLSIAQAEVLLDSLRTHAEHLLVQASPGKDLWRSYGVALIGQYMAGILPEAGSWEAEAIERFKPDLLQRFQNREGVWFSSSSNYQAMFAHLVHLFHTEVDPGDGELAAIAARLRDVLGWFVLPDRSLTLFGDYHTNVPLQSWVPRSGDGHRGLHTMRRTGWAIVKKRRSYLAAKASYHTDSHKHADELSFELYERGRRLISDSGHHDFDQSRWEAFAKSPEAHNVLTVDGERFPIRGAAYGSGMIATGERKGWFAILARNPSIRKYGVRHHRFFLYRPGSRLILVDVVRARRPHVYRRYIQVGAGINARRDRDDVALSAPGLEARLRSSGTAPPEIVEGRHRPLGGWVFPDTDQHVARPTVTFRDRATDANLLTEVRLAGGGDATPRILAATPRKVRVALSGGRRGGVLEIRRAGAQLRIATR